MENSEYEIKTISTWEDLQQASLESRDVPTRIVLVLQNLSASEVELLPQILMLFTDLRYLALDHFAITTKLINALTKCNIQSLNFQNVSIENCGEDLGEDLGQALGEALSKLPNLETLTVNNIEYKSLPSLVAALTFLPRLRALRCLNLNYNDILISKLALSIVGCLDLQELSISANRLDDYSSLVKALQNLKNLRRCDLSGLALGGIQPKELKTLFQILSKLGELEDLDLSWNHLDDAKIKILGELLNQFPKLKRLNLGNQLLSKEAIKTLSIALRKCRNAIELKLTNIDSKYQNIANILEQCPAIRTIELWRMSIEESLSLREVLPNCSAVETLDMSCFIQYDRLLGLWIQPYELRVEILLSLISILPLLLNLKVLNLKMNVLTLEQWQCLAKVLPKCSELKELNLAFCIDKAFNQREEKLQVLANLLPLLPKLQILNFSGNIPDIEKIKYFAKNLLKCRHIRSLTLLNSSINDGAIEVLSSVLPTLDGLEHLDLSGNKITITGLEILAGSLVECRRLKVLDMNGQIYSEQEINFLLEFLPLTTIETLRHETITCYMTEQQENSFRKILTQNTAKSWASINQCLVSSYHDHGMTNEDKDRDLVATKSSSLLENFNNQPLYIKLAIIFSGIGALVVCVLIVADAIINKYNSSVHNNSTIYDRLGFSNH